MDNFIEKIFRSDKKQQSFVLCIVTKIEGSAPGKPGMKMFVFEDGSMEGTVGGGEIERQIIQKAKHMMHKNKPEYMSFHLKKDLSMECGGSAEVYIEPVNPKCKLYIFGAGHIGKALANFAHELGFDIVIIDERPDIFNDYPKDKYEKLNVHYNDIIENIKYDKRALFVILTHKHIHDADILKLLCNKTYAYLGMIGSRTKVDKIKKDLISEKYMNENEIDKIDSPIGIKFKAITHQEIAVSILAKIIDVRNNL